MPRGKYVNHKGRARQFTPTDQLKDDNEQSTSEGEEIKATNSDTQIAEEQHSDDDMAASPSKKAGIEGLIEICNPNRQKPPVNLTKLLKETAEPAESLKKSGERAEKSVDYLSGRAKERIRKQEAHKSKQASADLARLAIIRQQREEAAERRLATKKEEDQAAAAMDITKNFKSSGSSSSSGCFRKKGRKNQQ